MDDLGGLGENKGTMTPGTKSKREMSGSSTAKKAMKSIRTKDQGRHLEETDHHQRMGYTSVEY